ncbi:MAG: hypothetical protein MK137_00500 [Rickettsiales bacterium]|nr:hypothetical protein [Rickettsiales bacterium]
MKKKLFVTALAASSAGGFVSQNPRAPRHLKTSSQLAAGQPFDDGTNNSTDVSKNRTYPGATHYRKHFTDNGHPYYGILSRKGIPPLSDKEIQEILKSGIKRKTPIEKFVDSKKAQLDFQHKLLKHTYYSAKRKLLGPASRKNTTNTTDIPEFPKAINGDHGNHTNKSSISR